MDRAAFGLESEEQVAEYLAKVHGWTVLARRVRFREGEIDLIMERRPDDPSGRLVFVEVKARRSLAFGAAVESVTVQKVLRMKRAVTKWRMQMRDWREGHLLLVGVEWRQGVMTMEEVWIE